MRYYILPILAIILFVGCTSNVNLRELDITSDELDFGIVELNKSVFENVEIFNNTHKTLEITIEFIADEDSDFELITDCESGPILPEETFIIEIKFRSETLGEKSAKLKLNYNHMGSPTTIEISAKCIKYDIQLHPYADTIEFKDTLLNTTSFMVVNIKNVGNFPLDISSITFDETSCFTFFAAQFPAYLGVNKLMMLIIYFSPVCTGEISDTMRVYYDSSSNPLEITLTGKGILPYVLDFLPIQYFSSENLPDDWSTEGINDCWEQGKPEGCCDISPYNGNSCVGTKITGNYLDNCDSRLISPVVNLTKSTIPVLSFTHWICTKYEQTGDGGFIEIRKSDTGKPDSWSAWETLSNVTPNYSVSNFNDSGHGAFAGVAESQKWKTVSVDIKDYRGKYVQIAWHFISDGSENSFGWYIDNVHIFEICENHGS